MASDSGLLYTLNNRFMDKPGTDLTCGNGNPEIKDFLAVKWMVLKYTKITHMNIILFVFSMFYAH